MYVPIWYQELLQTKIDPAQTAQATLQTYQVTNNQQETQYQYSNGLYSMQS